MDAGWSTRLRDLFGAALEDIDSAHIKGLVDGGVTEAAALDFKATLYGTTDDKKRELCKDIAAMRNDRGGVIVLGVADKNAVAAGCPEVPLSDSEERRMLQIVASGTAPHAAFDVRRIPGSADDKGFLPPRRPAQPLQAPRCTVDEGLRYPRRDGSTTRWLSEIEVADLYRDRFRGEAQQIERLSAITDQAKHAINAASRPWLMASLVPTPPARSPSTAQDAKPSRTGHARSSGPTALWRNCSRGSLSRRLGCVATRSAAFTNPTGRRSSRTRSATQTAAE